MRHRALSAAGQAGRAPARKSRRARRVLLGLVTASALLGLLPASSFAAIPSGNALELDGVDDHATAPDDSSLDLGVADGEDFTVESFFYVPDTTSDAPQFIVHKPLAYQLFINFNPATADVIVFKICPGGACEKDVAASGNLSTGWHHIAGVYDNEGDVDGGDLLSLFIDGSEVSVNDTFDITPGITNSSSSLNVGGAGAISTFDGFLEEARFSDSVRYDADYTVPTDPFAGDGNTRALWHFDDTSCSTSFLDSSGNGNTLTGQNGAQAGSLAPVPAAPAITDTDPDSPANDNDPEVKGTVPGCNSPTDVKIYDNATCTGAAVATDTVAAFTGAGITVSVAGDATTDLSARATNANGDSTCSNSFAYTEDSTAPAAPTITGTDPAPPANDNEPEVQGDAEAGSTVDVFSTADCSGAPLASGSEATFAGAGITTPVPGDATTDLRATATDGTGNESACSAAFAYTEDSTPNEAPAITDTDPDSPANDNDPEVKGTVGGDGDPDLAVVNGGSDDVSVLLGGAGTTFTGPTDHAVPGDSQAAVAIADYNSDAAEDLAVANQGTNDVSILLGDGDGGFAAPASVALGTSPLALATADFNGDADPDLAVTTNDSVLILLGGAGATFTGPTAIGLGTIQRSVAVGEFNGDSDPDLAIASYFPGSVQVLLGGEGGTFTGPTDFPTVQGTFSVAVGEFNGDANQDLVTSNWETDDISVLLGQGGGDFGAATNIGVGDGPRSVAVGNFDAGGDPDLAVVNTLDDDVSILLGGPGGGFAHSTDLAVGDQPHAVAVADFNGDGDPEVAVASTGFLQGISIFTGAAGATFTGPAEIGVGSGPHAIGIGDFNPDVANVKIYKDDASCTDPPAASGTMAEFGAGITVNVPGDQTTQLRARTVDSAGNISACSDPFSYTEDSIAPATPTINDTDPDSPANDDEPEVKGSGAEAGSTVKIFGDATCTGAVLGSGAAADFNGAAGITATVPRDQTTSLRVTATDDAGNVSGCSTAFDYADDSAGPGTPTITDTDPDSPANDNDPEVKGIVGGDGHPDLALANDTGDSVSVLPGAGGGEFAARTDHAVGDRPQSVAVGDFNRDGASDLAVANWDSDNISILVGDGDGDFAAPTNIADTFGPVGVVVGEFNGDSDPDLAVANADGADHGVSILLGDAGSTFSGPVDFATGFQPRAIAAGDFNADGDPDLAVANFASNSVSVLVGDAGGTFTGPTDYAVGQGPTGVAVGDFSGDTDPDLVVANSGFGENDVSVLRGVAGAGFTAQSDVAVGQEPRWVESGDFNNDIFADVVVANHEDDDVSILLGTPFGTFQGPTDFAVGNAPRGIAIGDFDRDSAEDLAVAASAADEVSVLLGDDTGSFGAATGFNTGNEPVAVAVGDFNDDATDVKVFKNATCAGAADATGTVASFTGAGITVNVSGDATTDLSAKSVDAAGNESACSDAFPYTEDSTPPTAPTITDTDPDPPANDNEPEVKGNAEAGSTVRIYPNATCTGAPLATGTEAAFAGAGITVNVPGDVTTNLRATATDAAGNVSNCSASFPYTEDSTAPAAPTITATDPASPANDNDPEVKGTVGGGDPTEVKIYENATCAGAADATGTVATFTGAGITVNVSGDATTDLSATSVDAAGNESACSNSIAYTEDSTNPAAPTITDTDPDSPANDNNPEVKGNAEAGSTVDIFSTADCSAAPLATGTEAQFSGAGITTPVPGDATTDLRATATDAAGNTSACSAAFPYTEDSTAPVAVITDTDPDSPANDNNPEVKGNTSADAVAVKLYVNDASCTDPADAQGTKALFEGAGITTPVDDDQATNLRATATDAAGNTSACSDPFLYTEDSTPPAKPTFTATDPASPANNNIPKLKGVANSIVDIFTTGDCSGAPAASGTSAAFADPGIPVNVADDTTTTFNATATDDAGNVSLCSDDEITYTEDSTNPAAPAITDTDPDSPANDNNPEVKGNAEAGSTIDVFSTADCSGAPLATGTEAQFSGAGITTPVPGDATTDLRATATDAAGNTSACSDPFPYTEDSTTPAAPTITDTDPDSPANDNNPEVKGNVEAGSTVDVFSTADCSGAPVAIGAEAEFSGAGITVNVPGDETTNLRATATDAAGNESACSDAFAYVEDSTAPAAPAITDTDPDSPSNISAPNVKGAAEAGSTVRLYQSNDCTGALEAQGTAVEFASPGLAASVAQDQTHNFTATATDAAGNTSDCSVAITYVEDSTAPSAPTINNTDPDSPANDENPKVKGDAEAGSTVTIYWTTCAGAEKASGTAAEFGGAGITTPVPTDTSIDLRATATDAAGNQSGCSPGFEYTEDSTVPAAPTITGTDPDSPANDNDPEVKGNAPADATDVKLYANDAGCTDPADAAGTKAEFEGAGITVNVPANQISQLRARAADGAGNESDCSAAFPYTEDSTPPAKPTFTATDPTSPANENNPKIKGVANSTVDIYTTADCSGAPTASGDSADFADPGIPVNVADNSTKTFFATATDDAGNTSACSDDSITYVEDSIAPGTPAITATDPNSPANDNNPEVKGLAGGGAAQVKLYVDDATCTDPPDAQGTSDDFEGAGITVNVPDDHTSQIRARSIDAAGNLSACSPGAPGSATAPFPYTEDSTPPAKPTFTATDPASPANENNPKIKGVANSTVDIYTTANCSGAPVASGTSAAFANPGIPVNVADNSATTFRATATDDAGNVSECSTDSITYTEDSANPNAPAITDTDPDSPSNDNDPEVKGNAPADATDVKLYANDAGCTDPADAEGTKAEFEGPGITVNVPVNQTSHLRARAVDAAGNESACSDSFAYTEDRTPPDSVVITDTDPDSPANDNNPEVKGNAEAGSTVDLFTDPNCAGAPLASGTQAQFAGAGITVNVPDDQTTRLRGTATDAAGNTAGCSAPFDYTEDSTAPPSPNVTDTDPDSPANDNEPEVKGNAEPGSIVEIYTSRNCSGPPGQARPEGEFAAAGITASAPDDQTTDFTATATDAAGLVSLCSNFISYTEDSMPPQTTITSGPSGTTSDRTPSFGFSSDEPNSSFECRVDAGAFVDCSGQGGSFTAGQLADGSHAFQVRATDRAGNTDQSPDVRSFVVDTEAAEDTTPPEVELGGKKKQDPDKKKGVVVKVGCPSELCKVVAKGAVKGASKLKLKSDSAEIPAGEEEKLKLKASKKVRNKIDEKLDEGAKLKARVTIEATDEAGNETVEKRTIKLK